METGNELPRVAITMGDAAGIGPEVIVRAWLGGSVHRLCRPLVVGHPEVFRRTVGALGTPLKVREARSTDEAFAALDATPTDSQISPPLVCLRSGSDLVLGAGLGHVDARAGQAAYDALVAATDLALAGAVDAVVTAPLCKAALHMAGHRYPGHTEILAELCRSDRFAMMLYLSPRLRVGGQAGLGVVHATLHVALRDALVQLTADRVVECCLLARDGMRRLGVNRPRIGVCAVNPHAGEDGLFGDEESRLIAPGVASVQAGGCDAIGPLPADTALVRARRGEFDAVVAMYHDQGHIALKLLGMHEAVNVTLGLPIIRTSPAHGTAMDIAGKYTAESSGMVAAIETAAQLAASNAP
jgi:4-hydroxythreonine-4-phosphate dehydrogenase